MKLYKLVLASMAMSCLVVAQSEAARGTVILAKGAVTATGVDKVNRVLAKGAGVEEGDVINTAQKSFAVIRMIDNTKLTLKPGTTIAIGKFNDEKGKEEACINLVKGGLRTVTGLIGKRKPEAFQVDTPIASIGIRGTDFIVRVCADDECLQDEQELAYGDVDSDDLADRTTVAESINKQLPEGLYGSCETGAIAMSQCAGQVQDFELGKCRIAQQTDCTEVELSAGKAGYAGLPISDAEADSTNSAATPPITGGVSSTESTSSNGGRVSALPSVPLILDKDPYFALSDLSDDELNQIDRFPESFGSQSECSIYGG